MDNQRTANRVDPQRYGDWAHWIADKVNVLVFKKPKRLFEWCDTNFVSSFVRACCQNMLVQNWMRHLPLLQLRPPAETACSYLNTVIDEVDRNDDIPLVVIDFCAGGGGPTPVFEKRINEQRGNQGLRPIHFKMSDLFPNIPAWEKHCSKSQNLSYVEGSVDAAHPPSIALSVNTSRNSFSKTKYFEGKPYSEDIPAGSNQHRVFRLFNLSFHHFDDVLAERVLKSTLENADGFAIIELQDRRLGCLTMMLFNFFLVLGVTWKWFPRPENRIHRILTYTGVLPFILCWDGVVSCLRTREFHEVMELVGRIKGVSPNIGQDTRCEIDEWTYTYRREMHTWPFGYVNWITGVRKSIKERQDSAYVGENRSHAPGVGESGRRQGESGDRSRGEAGRYGDTIPRGDPAGQAGLG